MDKDRSGLRTPLASGALALALLGVAAWTFGRAVEDWRYQLAGIANPFLGTPAPGWSIGLGIVVSVFPVGMVLLARAILRRIRPTTPHTGRRSRWRWRWLLIAGWTGYVAGSVVVIVGGGQVETRGSMRLELGAPIGSVVEIPATCRSVVGEPEVGAAVFPTLHEGVWILLRDVLTGRRSSSSEPGRWGALDRGLTRKTVDVPNVLERPALYIVQTNSDGSTMAQPPITFFGAYLYGVERILELSPSGRSGVAEVTGHRRTDHQSGISNLRYVNWVIPNDPWPETYELMVSWSCDPAKQ